MEYFCCARRIIIRAMRWILFASDSNQLTAVITIYSIMENSKKLCKKITTLFLVL